MQISPAPSDFSRRVDLHPVRAADNAHQLAFCQYGAASNASALGDMLDALNGFLGHLHYKTLP